MERELTPTEESDDYQLVQLSREGDEAAFAELVGRHREAVFRLAFRFTRNDSDQEDLAQEIFIQAYRKLETFQSESPFGHWLMRLAYHRCCDWWRKHGKGPMEVSAELLAEVCDSETERSLSREEARLLIDRALADLSPEDRLVITLLELEERSVREIAELTGWSESNVKTRAHRARKQLARNLEKQHE